MALFWKRPKRGINNAGLEPQARFPDVFPDNPLAYAAFRENDAKLKFWIPAPVDEALERLVETTERNRTKFLREMLFTHVYGVYDLARMRELKEGFYWVPPPASPDGVRYGQPLFSRSAPEAPELGKSTIDIQLSLPRRMREDFGILAETRGTKSSTYARHVLIGELFGRHFLPERQMLKDNALANEDDVAAPE